jgi:hypothetical protein
MSISNLKRSLAIAGAVSFLSLIPSFAESESGGFVFGGGDSESGGVYNSGAESDSGGARNSGSSSQSGGALNSGAESDSGGIGLALNLAAHETVVELRSLVPTIIQSFGTITGSLLFGDWNWQFVDDLL